MRLKTGRVYEGKRACDPPRIVTMIQDRIVYYTETVKGFFPAGGHCAYRTFIKWRER